MESLSRFKLRLSRRLKFIRSQRFRDRWKIRGDRARNVHFQSRFCLVNFYCLSKRDSLLQMTGRLRPVDHWSMTKRSWDYSRELWARIQIEWRTLCVILHSRNHLGIPDWDDQLTTETRDRSNRSFQLLEVTHWLSCGNNRLIITKQENGSRHTDEPFELNKTTSKWL